MIRMKRSQFLRIETYVERSKVTDLHFLLFVFYFVLLLLLLLLFFIVFCFFVEGGWLVVILFFWKTVPHFYIDIYQYIQYTNSRPPHDSWIVITTKFCSIRQVFTLRMVPVSIQNENEFTFKTSCQSIPQYFIILVNIGLDRGCYWNTNVQRTQCQGNNSGVCQAKRRTEIWPE